MIREFFFVDGDVRNSFVYFRLLDDDEDLKEICASNEEEKSCCRTRSRYYDSYNNGA